MTDKRQTQSGESNKQQAQRPQASRETAQVAPMVKRGEASPLLQRQVIYNSRDPGAGRVITESVSGVNAVPPSAKSGSDGKGK